MSGTASTARSTGLISMRQEGKGGRRACDRQGGPGELISQMAPPPRQSLDNPVGQNQKVQRQLVNIEPFVIELHEASIGTADGSVASFPDGHGHGHGHVYG